MSSPAVAACRAFVETVWEGETPTDQELIKVLERLLTIKDSRVGPKTDHWKHDPPEVDWKKTYTNAGKRFAHLGLYGIPDPQNPNTFEEVGDAIDDIADITRHVHQMIWYAENHNNEFAEDNFARFHFHWSEHAHDLLIRLRRGTDGFTD